jgi:hypothetical protein
MYGGYSLLKIQPLKIDNAYFGSTKQISKNLIVDPRVTYCTGIKHFDYFRFDKIETVNMPLLIDKLQTVFRNV